MMNLQQFLAKLDESTEKLSLTQLMRELAELDVSVSDFSEYFAFSRDRYQRNLIHRTELFEAILLCFEAGQRTPIHDHAGSACGVKVIQGTGVETLFKCSPNGWLYATASRELPQGGVVGSSDMDIHQLSNLQPNGKRLVTLHIYCPPLGKVGNYSIEDNSVKRVVAPVRQPLIHH